jgi:hypothetical protein
MIERQSQVVQSFINYASDKLNKNNPRLEDVNLNLTSDYAIMFFSMDKYPDEVYDNLTYLADSLNFGFIYENLNKSLSLCLIKTQTEQKVIDTLEGDKVPIPVYSWKCLITLVSSQLYDDLKSPKISDTHFISINIDDGYYKGFLNGKMRMKNFNLKTIVYNSYINPSKISSKEDKNLNSLTIYNNTNSKIHTLKSPKKNKLTK